MAARETWFTGLAVCLATFLPASVSHAADMVDSKLDGAWRIVRVEGDEEANKEAHGVTLQFKGNTLTWRSAKGDEKEDWNVRTTATQTPAQIDLFWTIEGETGKDDVTVPCIYAVDGDKLKLCFAKGEFRLCGFGVPEGHTGLRPKSFTEKKIICIIAERVKSNEK